MNWTLPVWADMNYTWKPWLTTARIGGKMSNDITQGYGPEEFRLKNGVAGSYVIQAKFFGSRKQTVLGKVTVWAFVYTNFGTKKEHKKVLTLQLDPLKDGAYTIGAIEFSH